MVPGRSIRYRRTANVSELVDMVYEYCRKRGLYPMRSLIRGNQTRTTGWLPTCIEHAGQCAY